MSQRPGHIGTTQLPGKMYILLVLPFNQLNTLVWLFSSIKNSIYKLFLICWQRLLPNVATWYRDILSGFLNWNYYTNIFPLFSSWRWTYTTVPLYLFKLNFNDFSLCLSHNCSSYLPKLCAISYTLYLTVHLFSLKAYIFSI